MATKKGLGAKGLGIEALIHNKMEDFESDGGGVLELDLHKIEPNRKQPRKHFDETALEELATSLKNYGMIQPVVVKKNKEGYYELIAGERRWRAAKIAGLTKIPAIIKKWEEGEAFEAALVENLQRRDLDFVEEASALQKLIFTYHLSQEEAAAKVGKSQSAVANKLRLLRLPQEVLTLLRKNGFTERHARALLRLPTPEAQKEGAELLVKEGWTVSRTERYVEEVLRDQAKEKKVRRPLFIRDVRFFLNTLDHSLTVMRSAGVDAKCQRVEEGDDILLTIRIPKAKAPSGPA